MNIKSFRLQKANNLKQKIGLSALLLAVAAGCPSARAQLTINPTFDSTITTAPNAVGIESAINAAITEMDSFITTPITVSINFKSVNTGLGASVSSYGSLTYAQYKTDLTTHATSANDATAVASLPAALPALLANNSSGSFLLTKPNLRALGEAGGANTGFDTTISLNMSLMNLSRTPGTQTVGNYDLETVALHEISESLGTGGNGSNLEGYPTADLGSLDMFRYSANGVRSYNPSDPSAYFSLDGGATKIKDFNQSGSGDWADWANGPTTQVQDAFGTPYENAGTNGIADLGANELTALDVAGYTLVPEPGTASLLVVGAVVAAFASRRKLRAS